MKWFPLPIILTSNTAIDSSTAVTSALGGLMTRDSLDSTGTNFVEGTDLNTKDV